MKTLRVVVSFSFALALTAALVVFHNPIGDVFVRVRTAIRGMFDEQFSYEAFRALERSHALALYDLQQTSTSSDARFEYIRASAYSQYPFVQRSLLTITGGAREGVVVDMPVFVADRILVGRVQAVKRLQSEVQTVFDPAWRSSVSIGLHGTRAALYGGSTLTLELIPADAPVAVGDVVVNVSPTIPFHAVIGEIATVAVSPNDTAWLEATVAPYADIGNVREVLLVRNFP